MPLSLIKLFIGADTTTTISPTNSKYFYINPADVAPGASLTIDAADFVDDTGADVTELPELTAGNSYFQVYINGALQENGNSTYTPGATGVGSLVFANPTPGQPILANQPVVLEVVLFDPESTTTVTT